MKTPEGLVVIDAGTEALAPELYSMINRHNKNMKIIAVYLTHGHGDHAGVGSYFQGKGVPVYVPLDEFWLIQTGAAVIRLPSHTLPIPRMEALSRHN